MRPVFFERPDAAAAARAGWRGQVWVWLPAMIACAVIAFESTGTFSAAHTSSWLRPIFERFLGHINDTVWDIGHHVFRKSGHFLGYGTVCLTFLRAWLLTLARSPMLRLRAWKLRGCGLALASTFLVASADEWHQTFIPGRTGVFSDVLLDTCGGIVMCGVVWLLFWRGGRLRDAQRLTPR